MDWTFNIEPIGKPRMTQRDKWQKRPAVVRYYAFKDALRLQARGFSMPESGAHVTFHLPMPKSWSKGMRNRLVGTAHQSKPDLDNLLKALWDSLCVEDKGLWDVRATKLWAESGRIEIKVNT